MNPTRRQRQQQSLYLALGTVKGFGGYLTNLQANLLRTNLYSNCPHIEILRAQLISYENAIRAALAYMKDGHEI